MRASERKSWVSLNLPAAALAEDAVYTAEAAIARAAALTADAYGGMAWEQPPKNLQLSAPQRQWTGARAYHPHASTTLANRRLGEALTAGSRSRARAQAHMGRSLEGALMAGDRNAPNWMAQLQDENDVLREARSHLKSQLQAALQDVHGLAATIQELTEANRALEARLRSAKVAGVQAQGTTRKLGAMPGIAWGARTDEEEKLNESRAYLKAQLRETTAKVDELTEAKSGLRDPNSHHSHRCEPVPQQRWPPLLTRSQSH